MDFVLSLVSWLYTAAGMLVRNTDVRQLINPIQGGTAGGTRSILGTLFPSIHSSTCWFFHARNVQVLASSNTPYAVRRVDLMYPI